MQLDFLEIDTGSQQLRVVPWSETILNVSLSGPFSTGTPLSGAVVGESPGVQSRVSSTEARSILETRDLAAELAADNDSIVFTRNGKPVTALQNILRPEDVNVEVTSGADGMRSTLDAVDRVYDRTAYTGVLEFRTDPDEHLFGLGQHEEGHFDLRGTASVPLPAQPEDLHTDPPLEQGLRGLRRWRQRYGVLGRVRRLHHLLLLRGPARVLPHLRRHLRRTH